MREGFVFYRSFYEAIKSLPPDQYKECVNAIIEYGLDGKEPQADDPLVQIVFSLTKPQIDANNRRRESGRNGGISKSKQNVANCSKSKQNVANGSKSKQEEPKEKDKEKEKEKDKDKENEKEKEVLGEEEETLPWLRVTPSKRDIRELTKEIMLKNAL